MPTSSPSAFAEIGRRVLDARLARGLTQEEVAHEAGLNVSYYGKLERGLNNPTVDTLIRIASRLGLDPGELVTGLSDSLLPPRAPRTRRGPRRSAG